MIKSFTLVEQPPQPESVEKESAVYAARAAGTARDRQSLRKMEIDQPLFREQLIAHILCVTCDTVFVTKTISRFHRLHIKYQ